MITIEHHGREDEIWLLDHTGATNDLQVILRDDCVFFIQGDDEAGTQVIQITPEQFQNIFVSLQLPSGTYDVDGQKVNMQ